MYTAQVKLHLERTIWCQCLTHLQSGTGTKVCTAKDLVMCFHIHCQPGSPHQCHTLQQKTGYCSPIYELCRIYIKPIMDHRRSWIQKFMLDKPFHEHWIVTSIHLFKIQERSIPLSTPEPVPQYNLTWLQRAGPEIGFMETGLGSVNNRTSKMAVRARELIVILLATFGPKQPLIFPESCGSVGLLVYTPKGFNPPCHAEGVSSQKSALTTIEKLKLFSWLHSISHGEVLKAHQGYKHSKTRV